MADWYDPAWRHRMLVTIDYTKVAATLTNFPWYVRGSDIVAAVPNFWDHVESLTGNDFLWTLADGTTKIPHSLDHFTSGSNFESHALIASLSHAVATERYLYWGNRNAAAQQSAAAAFTGHIARWGMGQASGNILDSLGVWNAVSANIAQGAAGKLYTTGGALFNGIAGATGSDVVIAGTIGAAHNANAGTTLSFWYKRAAVDAEMRIYNSLSSAAAVRLLVRFLSGNTIAVAARGQAGGTTREIVTVATYTDTASWHHVAAVVDIANDREDIYHDGALAQSGVSAFTETAFNSDAGVGFIGRNALGATPVNVYNGLLDEVRLLTFASTAERVLTISPNTFHSFGPIETTGGGTGGAGSNLGQHWLMRWPFRS